MRSWSARLSSVLLAGLAALILSVGAPGAGNLLYVNNTDSTCGGQSPCYGSIQAAVDAVGTGDTVRIQAGVYPEHVLVANAAEVLIEADPDATPGSVVVDPGAEGPLDCLLAPAAIEFSASVDTTLRGLTITGAGGFGILLRGGPLERSENIRLVGNRIHGNGVEACGGGVRVGADNTGTLVAHNVIYANTGPGIDVLVPDPLGAGVNAVWSNTVAHNEGDGIRVATLSPLHVWNNVLFGNGTEDGYGFHYLPGDGVTLRYNLLCGNGSGEVWAAPTNSLDSVANLTPTGTEGVGFSASPNCDLAANVFDNAAGPDATWDTADDDFFPTATSPVVDSAGAPTATHFLAGHAQALADADFAYPAATPRPADGDDDGASDYDRGAFEYGFPPEVEITSPADGSYSGSSSVTISGDVSGTEPLSLEVAGDPVTPSGGTFSHGKTLPDGSHNLSAEATNTFGTADDDVDLTVDTVAPVVTLTAPTEGAYLTDSSVTVTGTVADGSPIASLTLNGISQTPSSAFSLSASLAMGSNTLTVVATDAAGNSHSGSVSVWRIAPGPLQLSIDSPIDDATVATSTVTVSGTVGYGSSITVEGITATVTGNQFSASGIPLEPMTNVVTAQASRNGENTSASIHVIRLEEEPPAPPPDPGLSAPAIDPTVATTLPEATEFLYTGTDPVQTGVAAGTIEDRRASVLRGQVKRRSGGPLESVRVSVVGHPELGETRTRADGMFDLVVNGGGVLTVQYQREGFLPAQRQIEALWGEYRWLPDVVLIPVDAAVTEIDLSTSGMKVARGSEVTDNDGIRRATLLFPEGLTATMELPDGSTPSLSTLHVRATEYTVGNPGPEAMPAQLPPTSAYTYAAEFTVDEAIVADAQKVSFSTPVVLLLENFLGFDAGIDVPLGTYDSEKAGWLPKNNGRVIQVVSETNGRADLDVDGDGQADTGTALSDLGITDAERDQIAALYAPADELWRVLLPHFSSMDLNLPTNRPEDAEDPRLPDPDNKDAGQGQGCTDKVGGCIIGVQNQTLRDSAPIVGTPFELYYSSERVLGRKADVSTLDIPLTRTTVPDSLKRVALDIQVAGQRYRQSFPPDPNQRHVFVWDGYDAWGRKLTGRQRIIVRVGYVYDSTYQQTARFGRPSYGAPPAQGPYAPSRDEIRLWQTWRTWVQEADARALGLGGWSIDAHHFYDPVGKVVLLGDGSRRDAGFLPGVIRHVSGELQHRDIGNTGDDNLASEATWDYIEDLAVAPDGSIYVATTPQTGTTTPRVRRIRPDGIVENFAGSNCNANSGDNGAAVDACIANPSGLAIAVDGSVLFGSLTSRVRRVRDGIITTAAGRTDAAYDPADEGTHAPAVDMQQPQAVATAPDGTFYVADDQQFRIWGVDPANKGRTYAGNGLCCTSGDGGSALNARVGHISGLDVGPDGSLYLVGEDRVRVVTPEGKIVTVAGGGDPTDGVGDGLPAQQARIQYADRIAVAPDGGIFVAHDFAPDYNGDRLRYISPQGIIHTVAGTGEAPTGPPEYGGPALQPLGRIQGIDIAPNGTIYLATRRDVGTYHQESLVLAVEPAFSEGESGETPIPSADGSEIYVFDGSGRHLRTEHALTGATLLTFTYDANGLLAQITDAYGNVTGIERNAAGAPTAIVAPFGQRTELSLDADGYLSAITNPAGETVGMTYHPEGLLATLTEPRGYANSFTYDSLGRLTRDDDAAGGFKTFAPAKELEAITVTLDTAEGRTRSFRLESLPTGEQKRINTDAADLVTTTVIGDNGTTQTTLPDGVVATRADGADPRFGMLAPVHKSLAMTTPDGISSERTWTRTITYQTPGDPDSGLATQTDTIALNGRTTTRVFDASARTMTTTSPEGRVAAETFDTFGRLTNRDITGLAPISRTYDAAGRLSTLVEGSGGSARTTTLTYNANGWLEKQTDPLQRDLKFEYDAAGRVTKQILPDLREIQFTYDANGTLSSLTPPGRPPHVFRYTEIDLEDEYEPPALAGVTDPVTTYTYNLDRQVDEVVRPGAEVVDYEYDGAGRLNELVIPRGSINYTYQATTGNLDTVTAPGGERLAFGYDGDLQTSATWSGTVSGSVGFTYDNDLRVAAESVNGGNSVSYAFDDDGLLTSAGLVSFTRDPDHGLLTDTALGVVTTARTYNAFGELASADAKVSGSSVYQVTYTRDSLGRITQLVETLQGTTTTTDYTYTPAGQLDTVTVNGTLINDYSFDANGNRLTEAAGGPTLASYDDQDRLLAYGNLAFTYDDAGDLTSRTDTTTGNVTDFTYDALGNLTQVDLPDGRTITYVIDGANRRIGQKVDGALEQAFLYRDHLNPVAELDGAGNLVSRFVYGSKPNVPDYMIKGGTTYRILSDQLGSVRLVVDTSTGVVAQRIDYDVWGNVTNDTSPGFQPFAYAGGLYDAHTRLVRFGARDYDAEVGRWTMKDPIRFDGGLNLYGYALNDPVNLVDPNGLWPFGLPKPSSEQKDSWSRMAQDYVPDLSQEEASNAVDDAVEGADWGDAKDAWDAFGTNPDPPDSLSDLTPEQKEFVKDFLDKLPDRNDSAVEKIKQALGPCP